MASAVIGALRVNLGIDTAAFSEGLKGANAKLKSVGAQMTKIGAGLSVVSAGIAAGLASNLNAADAMAKTAQKIGVPIEELSRLAYVADLSGVSMQGMQTAVGRLSRQMNDARAGVGEAVDAFAQVGVSATDSEGNLRSATEVMADLADVFAAMPDGAEKTALSMELMGRSGADMIPMLNGGAQAIRDLAAEADAMGIVITPEMGKAAEQFNDNLTRLKTTFSGIGTQIAAQLAPVLADLSDRVVEVSKWFQDLSPRVQKFASVGTLLGLALGPVVVALGALAIGIAAIGIPAAAVIAGVVALTAAVTAFWPEIEAAGAAVVAFGRDALGWLAEEADRTITFWAELPGKFTQIGRDVISGLLDGLREKWEEVKAWFTGLADAIPQWMRERLGIQSPSTVFAEIGRNIMQGLGQGLDGEKDAIRKGMDGFAGDIASAFRGILTGATDFKGALSDILGSVGGRFIDAGIGGIGSLLGIPAFANGTNFAPGGLALVGERGPELVDLPRGSRVTPNHALGSGGERTATITINVNGARGNAEISDMVSQGVSRGLAQVREVFADGVVRVNGDPRMRGAV